ncbi:MAG TPA: acyltransferase family protein [Streptosporangiaceae bacterium]|jgi:peptidoglycan/LPS O-acetylase OafA/YrhL/lysophospholipase L1-like esterase|nr:acyltransferase family protein [Streptosporangiaceae bacterium]
MPKPIKSDQRYMPGLDGLRAIAVLAVIAFHEQFSWAPGGLLGVGVFFTLSGYLITDLLLGQWRGSGRLHLADFWLRRARRLLPALFAMLAIVTAWVTIADRSRLSGMRGPVGAAATYWSNWYLIVAHSSYFSRFAAPQPLDHLWSLAVEEQFYLIWPWLLLLGLLAIRRRPGAVGWLALPTLVLAAGSAVLMLVLYQPGFDPTRVYEGTDTRAAGLLIGAALAMVWPSSRAARAGRTSRIALDVPGFAGLAVIAIMVWRVGQYSPFLYRGGLVLLSLATAAVVAAAACPLSLVGRTLSWAPLRWLGVRSYGIYLWHYPVIVLTSPANGTVSLPRAAAQITASIVLAALSWRFLEEPIRHGALGRTWARLRSGGARRLGWGGAATAGATAGVLAVACTGLIGAPAPLAVAGGLGGTSALASSTNSVSHASGHAHHNSRAGTTPAAAAAAGPPRTSCKSVVHIGDSTSEGMVSSDYLPNPAQRLPEQYEDVGVQTVYTNITGARSVVEVLPGTTNGYDAAKALVRSGFRGCWVLALGTNDTADVAAGSEVGLATRIQRMMSVAGGAPVMWVNVISLLSSGPYAEANMRQWDEALLKACAQYPNMRVFNWAALAERPWFINDGIHYTSAGYAIRAHAIAEGLAKAFPLGGQSAGCVVQ